METVEVVIRLPKRTYDRVSKRGIIAFGEDAYYIGYAVTNGTVLPKEHDDLVELGKVIDIVTEYVPDDDGSVGNTNLKDLLYEVENMEHIIEADKEIDDD